jgi:ADP-ribose pyrophosphatase YjhB (NUDIX family)
MDPMVDLIERSEHLFLAGVVLSHATQRHRAQIEAQLAKGSRFRFLVLDPDSPDVDAIAKSFDLLPNQVRDDIRATLRDIEILGNKTLAGQTGSVEVRLLCREPSFSFALSNPESQKGYFCAGLRAYGHRSTTRPHFVLRAPDNWFYYFKENCEALWAAAAPWHGDPKAIKPVAQKAGVVPYRLSREGQTEVAVITARANPARWIFPVGDVNRGETLSEAAARECQEESGCVVEIVSKLGLLEFDVGDVISRMTFFAGLVKRETSYREKDRQLKWVKLPELAQELSRRLGSNPWFKKARSNRLMQPTQNAALLISGD